MRKKIVAGNWKMNKTSQEATILADALLAKSSSYSQSKAEVVISPPYIYLSSLRELLKAKNSSIRVAAQNCHSEEKGAFTGEVAASMLKSIGTDYVIIGHSERRQYFNETNAQLNKKLVLALKNELIPIYCIGETLQERESNNHFDVIEKQLTEVLTGISISTNKFVIAYEPVWAIGTGKTATVEQAQEMHAFIRTILQKIVSSNVAEQISILYGGSCNAQNAKSLFACKDIDGGLIGGASLDADQFIAIINSF